MLLTKRQKKYLRGLAQNLSPVVMLGKEGLSSPLRCELDRALEDHELVKVKIQEEEKSVFEKVSLEMQVEAGAELIQTIGRMAIYFRPNPDKKKKSIVLPSH